MDDDALPAADWLKNARRLIAKVPEDCAIIGGTVLPIFPPAMTAVLGRRWLQMVSTVTQNGEGDQTQTARVIGANVLFRRDALVEAGGFPTNLGRYGANLLSGEEKLLQERLVAGGRRIWCSDRLVAGHKIQSERLTLAWIRKRANADGMSDRRIEAIMKRPPTTLRLVKALLGTAVLFPLQLIAPAKYEIPIRFQYNLGWIRETLRLMGNRPEVSDAALEKHNGFRFSK